MVTASPLSALHLLLLTTAFLIGVDNQTTRDIMLSTLAPPLDFDNITSISLDLDEILAAVNKSDSVVINPPPGTLASYGDRLFMHAVNNNYNVEDLMGKTLRLIVPKLEPPYVNYVNFTDAERHARGYGPGAVMEILNMMMQNLNLTYVIVESGDQQWGSFENGNWTGAFGALYRGEADILVGAAIMQYDRSLITDLTFPFRYAPTAMLIKSPTQFTDNTWLIVTQPFKWEVWGLTAISIAVSGVILFIYTRFLVAADEIQYTFVDSVWVFFSVFVQQGLPVQPRSWSCRVMLALWWLASITLMATFTGSLVALFAVDRISLPFNNLQQLVRLIQSGKWSIIMDGTSLTRTNMIRESESPTYKALWYEMSVKRRVTYVPGIDAGIAMVLMQPNMVLLGPDDTLQYQSTIDCRLTKLEEGILPTYLSIPLQRDSPYSTYLSNLVRDLVERGFIDKWINDYTNYQAALRGSAICNTTTNSGERYLDLSKAQGAFWVLIAGIALAVTILVVEFVYRGIYKMFFKKKAAELDVAQSVRGSQRSNTTSSVSSDRTGGEPEILKLDRTQIDAYQNEAMAKMGQTVRYEGTKF